MTPDKPLSSDEELVEIAESAFKSGEPYLSDFNKWKDAIAAIRPTIEREARKDERERVIYDLCEQCAGRRFLLLDTADSYFMMLRCTAKEWGISRERFEELKNKAQGLTGKEKE